MSQTTPPHAAMRAADLMTTNVLSVPPGMPVPALARLLSDRHISGAPVVDPDGRLLGIVTEADLIRRLAARGEGRPGMLETFFSSSETLAERYSKSFGLTAGDVMTPAPLLTVAPDAPAEAVAKLFEEEEIRRVPVVSGEKLLGVVSRADLLRAILPEPSADAAGLSDGRVAQAVMARIKQEPWTDVYWTTVTVQDGVLEFHGFVRSEEVRRALRVLGEGVPGVKRVEDRMELFPAALQGIMGV
jgi:CBS domain-containing protein